MPKFDFNICKKALAGVAVFTLAYAQEAAAQLPAARVDASAETASSETSEIVIIGKRAQGRRNIAGKVDVLTANALAQVGARDAEDIFKLTPGIQFSKGAADGSFLTIRGVGTNTSSDNTSIGQLPTGIYIEDVPYTDPFQYISTPDIATFDLDGVKVLRGPQGALYGSGSLGGAINYTFHKPDLTDIGGVMLLSGDMAQHGETQPSAYGAINIPIVKDKAALRFVGQYQNDPGYQDNIGTGQKDANGRRVLGQRVLFLAKPVDDLTIDALYMSQRSKQDDTSVSQSKSVRYNDSLHPSVYDSRFSLAKLEINYDLGPVKFTSLTAHQDKERNLDGDLTRLLVPDITVGFDVAAADFFGIGPYPLVKEARNIDLRRSNTNSQEFRISSAKSSNFNWLIGAFGQEVSFDRSQNVFLVGAKDPTVGDLYFNVQRDGKATESAVFGEAEMNWGGLALGVGGRYFRTSVKFHQTRKASLAASVSDRNLSFSETGFTPKFEARYRFDSSTVVYAVAAKGFRFGGANTGIDAPPYKSDNLWSYETGMRLSAVAGLDLDLDISGFYIDWSSPQVTVSDQNGFLLVANLGRAVSKGIELNARWKPTDALRINGGLTYTDPKTKSEFQSTRNFATDEVGGYTGNFVVPAGVDLPGTPQWQASLQPEFTIDGPSDTAFIFSGSANYVGERRAQIDSDLKLASYTTVDVRVRAVRGPWEVALGVSNLTDTKGVSQSTYTYYSTGTGTDGYEEPYLIRPRIYNVSVKRSF